MLLQEKYAKCFKKHNLNFFVQKRKNAYKNKNEILFLLFLCKNMTMKSFIMTIEEVESNVLCTHVPNSDVTASKTVTKEF
jgi:hypothetical protein